MLWVSAGGPLACPCPPVCMRCHTGVVLRAPAGAEPRHGAPCLIVDRQLAVQAVSRRSEVVLSVDERAGVGCPLEEFLICDNGHCDNGEVAALVELAMAGAEASKRLELGPVANPGIRLRGRFTRCGPRWAALLVLTPLAAHATAASNGHPATNGNLARVSGPDGAASPGAARPATAGGKPPLLASSTPRSRCWYQIGAGAAARECLPLGLGQPRRRSR